MPEEFNPSTYMLQSQSMLQVNTQSHMADTFPHRFANLPFLMRETPRGVFACFSEAGLRDGCSTTTIFAKPSLDLWAAASCRRMTHCFCSEVSGRSAPDCNRIGRFSWRAAAHLMGPTGLELSAGSKTKKRLGNTREPLQLTPRRCHS